MGEPFSFKFGFAQKLYEVTGKISRKIRLHDIKIYTNGKRIRFVFFRPWLYFAVKKSLRKMAGTIMEKEFLCSYGTPQEERQKLINKYLEHPFFDENAFNDFLDFISLEKFIFNESERKDIEDIVDNISVGLGALDQAWDDLYAFNQRMLDEKALEKCEDKS